MPNILVEIEEEAFYELDAMMKENIKNVKLLKHYTDVFILVEQAARLSAPITLGANDIIHIDGISIIEHMAVLQERRNESTTDA